MGWLDGGVDPFPFPAADASHRIKQVAQGGLGIQNPTIYDVLCGNGTGPVQAVTNGTTGQALVATSGAFPSWGAVGVPGGGTGQITLTAHSVLLGEGTAAVGFVGPSASTGLPLISQGATSDPIFSALGVPGGGTGQVTLTAHAVLIGEGTGGVVGVGPNATTGLPLLSQGAAADPAFGVLGPTGGGTGVSSTTLGDLLVGSGTNTWALLTPGGGAQVLTADASSTLGVKWANAQPTSEVEVQRWDRQAQQDCRPSPSYHVGMQYAWGMA